MSMMQTDTQHMTRQDLEVFHINTVFAIALGQFLAVLPIEWRFSPERKRQIIFKKDNPK